MKAKLLALFGAVLIGFSFGQTAFSQKRPRVKLPPRAAIKQTAEDIRRLETFEKVWTTLSQNFFDPTFTSQDWQKLKQEFEPKVKITKTDKELHELLGQMIGRLGVSHLAIIPPEVFQTIEAAKVQAKAKEVERERLLAKSSGNGDDDAETEFDFDDPLTQYGIGVDLRLLNGQFVITRIDKNSAAEYAGLKVGYAIEKVNDVSLTDFVRRLGFYTREEKKVLRYLPSQVVEWFLNGEKDSVVSLSYKDEGDVVKEVKIHRERLRSSTILIAKNIPEKQLQFVSESLSDDIGYIRFNYFALSVIDKFCKSIGELNNKKGIIIDLRGNFGGVLATMVGLGGMLTQDSINLGTSIFKNGRESLVASSKLKNFKGKIIVLIDDQTVSAAEVFAAALQESGRATVVGDNSAGEALPSVSIELPTGAVMQYPIANYVTANGAYLEGRGVKPDIAVSLHRAALLKNSDEQLSEALRLIEAKPNPIAATVEGSVFTGDDTAKPGTARTSSEAPKPLLPPARRPAPPQSFTVSEAKKPAENIKDAAAGKVIDEFLAEIGGAEAIRNISTYALTGTADLLVRGTLNSFDYQVYLGGKDKYSEILSSAATGEIREIHNGPINFVQTDYGASADLGTFADVTGTDLLSSIRKLTDPEFFVSLKYQGIFTRDGRKVHLIDGKSKAGMIVALTFDVETKLMTSLTGSYYGMTFGDYRKVGGVELPFYIEREGLMKISFGEIKINQAIDEINFTKKPLCFDQPN